MRKYFLAIATDLDNGINWEYYDKNKKYKSSNNRRFVECELPTYQNLFNKLIKKGPIEIFYAKD